MELVTNHTKLAKSLKKEEIIGDALRLSIKATSALFSGVFWLGCKLAYPILGNLSWRIQDSLENRLGRYYYDPLAAFHTTLLINPLLYITAGIYGFSHINYISPVPKGVHEFLGGIIGGILGITESTLRIKLVGPIYNLDHMWKPVRRKDIKIVASPPGKLVSLPLEGIAASCSFLSERYQQYKTSLNGRVQQRLSAYQEEEQELRRAIAPLSCSEKTREERLKVFERALVSDDKNILKQALSDCIEDKDFTSAYNLAQKLGEPELKKVMAAEQQHLEARIRYLNLPEEVRYPNSISTNTTSGQDYTQDNPTLLSK